MGLFSRKGGGARYASNTAPEQLDLFEQLDRTVVIAVKGGSPLIDGALHLCVTQAGYEKAATALGLAGENSGPCQAVLGLELGAETARRGG